MERLPHRASRRIDPERVLGKTAILLLVPAVLGVPVTALAEPDLAGQPRPKEVLDGTPVAGCGWPTVVELWAKDPFTVNSERCTGVYIGGRVILTAAHCMYRGFYVPTSRPCETAADCPSVGEYSDVIDELDCFGDSSCSDPDLSLSSSIRYARFGTDYGTLIGSSTDGHIRRAVPIAYCRRWDDDEEPSSFADFAYCILTAEPDVHPVPVMMDCEADQYLPIGTPITAVGFGQTSDGTSGTKRFATAQTVSVMNSFTGYFALGTAVWNPGKPSHGDSGGPLFARLPDNTWRVVATAVDTIPGYNAVWNRMEWLAQDPHVDIGAILPCHDVEGNWDPGPNCGGFPTNPNANNGGWRTSPACAGNVGGVSQTCTAIVLDQGPELVTPSDAPSPIDEAPRAMADTQSCRSGGSTPGTGELLGLLLLVFGRRRRDVE